MRNRTRIVVQLIHIHGPDTGKIQEFDTDVITIGRHPSSSVCFPRDLRIVSRRHAEIVREGNRFKLIDYSTNRTYVNGKPVKEAYLRDGDVLTFAEGGPKVSFLTQIVEEDAPSDREKPEARRISGQKGGIEEKAPPDIPRDRDGAVRSRSSHEKGEAPPKEDPRITPKTVPVGFVIQYGPSLRSFKQLPIIVGKHPRCDFILDVPDVLDHHVQFFYADGQYWVKDLTGRDLVRVNERPVSPQVSLKSDDLVALTPAGPVFRYLGEGRLAEVEGADQSGGPPSTRSELSKSSQEGDPPSKKGKKSVFKRFLKK